MKSLSIVGSLIKPDSVNPQAEVTTGSAQSNGRLPIIEMDIEFEDLEEKTAPQSDTSYLDRMGPCFY